MWIAVRSFKLALAQTAPATTLILEEYVRDENRNSKTAC